jgi:membrane protease YdiL (CAAX protease family)
MNEINNSEPKFGEFEVRNLILFILIACGWTWLFYLPSILSPTGGGRTSTGTIELHILILESIGNFGPFIGAVTLTFINEGKEGIKQLWKRFCNFDIKMKWIFVIFFLMPILSGIAFLIAIYLEGIIPILIWTSQPWLILFWFIILFTFAGGLAEEFGWRGYAIDRLQAKYNALYSSIALGIIWAFWHLPFWFVAGGSHQSGSFLWFLVLVIFLSILYTWIYNNTGGNLLAVTIFHTMSNLAIIILFPLSQTIYGGFYYFLILITFTIFIIIMFKPKKLMLN